MESKNIQTLQDGAQPKTSASQTRFAGAVFVLLGLFGFWWNWHELTATGAFSIKLTIFSPLGVFGGLLMAFRPEWAGPRQPDAQADQKIAVIAVMLLTAVASAADFYFLSHYRF